MKEIKELVQIFVRQGDGSKKPCLSPFDPGSKLDLFFWGIAEGQISTDEDAYGLLYQAEKETSTYRKVKKNLQNGLLDSLCHEPFKILQYTDYQKEFVECHRQWVMVKILTVQNAGSAAISLATKLMKKTIQYEFTYLSYDLAAYMRLQYAFRGQEKPYQEAKEQADFFRQVHDAECFAEELYTYLALEVKKGMLDAGLANVNQRFQQIASYMQLYQSYRLHLYGRLTEQLLAAAVGNYNQALESTTEAITFFQSKPFEARGALQIFFNQKLTYLLRLRRFEEGKLAIVACEKYQKVGTYNWFLSQELFVQLAMHTQQYQVASDHIFRMMAQKKYEFLPENVKEVWRVYEAYVYPMMVLGVVEVPKGYTFKLGKFLNDTPTLSKDKGGMNVAIRVIQFLILLADRKRSQLHEETESLEQYCYRHLNKPATRRGFLFIKMLLQIPAGQYDLTEIDKRASKYLKNLQEIPFGRQNLSREVIPFDQLWQIARSFI